MTTRHRRRKLLLSGALALACMSAATATLNAHGGTGDSGPPATEHQRGALVSVTRTTDLDAADVRARLYRLGINVPAEKARYGVHGYRVVYRTVDVDGRPTTASQLVALPDNGRGNRRGRGVGQSGGRLGIVSWLHGTSVYRGDAPSVRQPVHEPGENVPLEPTDRAAVLLFATTGRAVSAPDYLGLGQGPGRHPYGHRGATVSASLDALRASRALAREHGRELERNVAVSGFSQGGNATMLLGEALQAGRDRHFGLGALAPIAGPFDLTAFARGAADDTIANSSLYLAYLTTAWDRLYGLYEEPEEAFRAPYDGTVEELFDGHHKPAEVAEQLPAKSAELFTPAFLDRMREPTGRLARELGALDRSCAWRPEVPVSLYHAGGDKDVVPAHARHCASQVAAEGGQAEVVGFDDAYDHNATPSQALPLVLRQFDAAGGGVPRS